MILTSPVWLPRFALSAQKPERRVLLIPPSTVKETRCQAISISWIYDLDSWPHLCLTRDYWTEMISKGLWCSVTTMLILIWLPIFYLHKLTVRGMYIVEIVKINRRMIRLLYLYCCQPWNSSSFSFHGSLSSLRNCIKDHHRDPNAWKNYLIIIADSKNE